MMDGTNDRVREAALAQWHYQHRDTLDAEQGEPVEVEVSPQLAVTMSFRLPGAEADAIRSAAAQAGTSLSEWIRDACRQAAKIPRNHPSVNAEVVELAQALDAAGLEVRRRPTG